MAKHKVQADKVKDLKEFVKLTWEVVRRNPEYQNNYIRFLQNYGLQPEEVKPRKQEDGSSIVPWHPARHRQWKFDQEKGKFVQEVEAPDTERCNLSFMLQKWGFACDPDEPIPQGHSWYSAFISKDWIDLIKESVPQPLLSEESDLQKLPGVLKVEKWPEVRLGEENKISKPCQWEINDPNLTVTINLQAPSHLTVYALEILLKVCKVNLGISDDKKINIEQIQKKLETWDLKQKGIGKGNIANHIPVKMYVAKDREPHGGRTPEMIAADQKIDCDTRYKTNRIDNYVSDIEAMIKKGAVI